MILHVITAGSKCRLYTAHRAYFFCEEYETDLLAVHKRDRIDYNVSASTATASHDSKRATTHLRKASHCGTVCCRQHQRWRPSTEKLPISSKP